MTDFLLEIFSEEIPARMQKNAAQNFAAIAYETLSRAGLNIAQQQVKIYIAPRRLTLYLDNLRDEQTTQASKRIGPKTTADKKAIEGFLRSCGLKSESDLQIINHNGSPCFLYEKPATSTKTLTVITQNLSVILQKMTNFWPKTMRYDINDSQAKWVRPIRNIACLFGNQIVEFEFAGLRANNLTYGNFLYSSKPLQINACEDYQNILRDNFVIVDHLERKQNIVEQVKKLANSYDLELVDDENSALFDEVTGLCEWPVALLAGIDKKFMHLQKEVLILTLKLNQKYFCLQDHKKNLSSKFIFVSSAIIDEHNRHKIIEGNEKVVRARLADANFVVEEDLKIPLKDRVDDLHKIIFHQKLGSVYDKCDRIENLAELLSIWIAHCDINLVKKSAFLCKADLATKAIAELPELQGKIGAHYAKLQLHNQKVSTAIYEHYLPLGANSELPTTPLGCALSIADKIDTIVGMFLANEKPTSSKDPFALRRAALGIIRIALAYEINLPLKVLIDKSLKLYKPHLQAKLLAEQNIDKKTLHEEISRFLFDRLKSFLKENKNVRGDIANAAIDDYVIDLSKKEYCDILIVAKKALSLNELIKNPQNIAIIELYKRSANVLAIEEKRDKKTYVKDPNSLLFKSEYEKTLSRMLKKITPDYTKFVLAGKFEEAFALLRILHEPLTQFFDHVQVNDKSKMLRQNRLLLLSKIRFLFNQVADFSGVEKTGDFSKE